MVQLVIYQLKTYNVLELWSLFSGAVNATIGLLMSCYKKTLLQIAPFF